MSTSVPSGDTGSGTGGVEHLNPAPHASEAGSGSEGLGTAKTTPVPFTSPASQLAIETLLLDDLSVIRLFDCNGKRWPLAGGTAPIAPLEDGVTMAHIDIMEDFKHIDQAGAHQDGVTYLDTTYDPTELELSLTFFAQTTGGRRNVYRQWKDGWDPKQTCRMVWFTKAMGNWWIDLRIKEAPRFTLPLNAPISTAVQWPVRADFPFWSSYDSISPTMIADSYGNLVDPNPTASLRAPTNFLRCWNRGNILGWPRHLLQGPGTFKIGDNGGPRTITLPLTAGQLALINTLPHLQTVTEVNSGTDIYPLLQGRFSTGVAAGVEVRIPISVTGSVAGVTSAMTSLTPWRSWPE